MQHFYKMLTCFRELTVTRINDYQFCDLSQWLKCPFNFLVNPKRLEPILLRLLLGNLCKQSWIIKLNLSSKAFHALLFLLRLFLKSLSFNSTTYIQYHRDSCHSKAWLTVFSDKTVIEVCYLQCSWDHYYVIVLLQCYWYHFLDLQLSQYHWWYCYFANGVNNNLIEPLFPSFPVCF